MSDISKEQNTMEPYRNWKTRLGAIETLLQTGRPFPDSGGFYDSIWHIWKKRIENGQIEEERQIRRIYEKWKEQVGYLHNPFFDPDDLAGEDYWQTYGVTNSMCAALVVSIWSKMESFLKSIASICSEALGERENNGDASIKGVLKKLKKFGIQVKQLTNYATVNAVRILNNSYKHSNGRYSPKEGRPHTQIDRDLLSKWKIVKNQKGDKIDYSRIPIEEIVLACNGFCTDVLKRTEAILMSKTR